jgi:hypothetical protein
VNPLFRRSVPRRDWRVSTGSPPQSIFRGFGSDRSSSRSSVRSSERVELPLGIARSLSISLSSGARGATGCTKCAKNQHSRMASEAAEPRRRKMSQGATDPQPSVLRTR